MPDEPQDEPARTPQETRRIHLVLWVIWVAAGIFLVISAVTNPNIVNVASLGVWIIGSIAQLLSRLRGRKFGSDQGS